MMYILSTPENIPAPDIFDINNPFFYDCGKIQMGTRQFSTHTKDATFCHVQ